MKKMMKKKASKAKVTSKKQPKGKVSRAGKLPEDSIIALGNAGVSNRRSIASNPKLSQKHQEFLMKDSDFLVRISLASNPNLSLKHQMVLANDPNEIIRDHLTANPNLHKKAQTVLLNYMTDAEREAKKTADRIDKWLKEDEASLEKSGSGGFYSKAYIPSQEEADKIKAELALKEALSLKLSNEEEKERLLTTVNALEELLSKQPLPPVVIAPKVELSYWAKTKKFIANLFLGGAA